MPVLPYLTDSVEHLDRALAAIKDSGASYVIWTALHLKPGVKEWYLGWLAQHHPEHEAAYRRMYAGGSYAPKAYRQWLADRMRPLLAKHRLPVGSADDATGATRSRSAGIVARPAPSVPAAQPALF
jgi:DNA repair photolyase